MQLIIFSDLSFTLAKVLTQDNLHEGFCYLNHLLFLSFVIYLSQDNDNYCLLTFLLLFNKDVYLF